MRRGLEVLSALAFPQMSGRRSFQRNLEYGRGCFLRVMWLALLAQNSSGHVVFRGLAPEGPLEADSTYTHVLPYFPESDSPGKIIENQCFSRVFEGFLESKVLEGKATNLYLEYSHTPSQRYSSFLSSHFRRRRSPFHRRAECILCSGW